MVPVACQACQERSVEQLQTAVSNLTRAPALLPHLPQATVRKPPYRNMLRALGLEYGIGASLFVVLAIIGFWAYGNSV